MKTWESAFGKSFPRVRLAVVIVSAVLVVGPALAADVVVRVAPTGDDAGDGSQAKPVASLIGARDAVRRPRAAGKAGPVRVVVADGIYRFAEPLVLTPEDGGSAEAPVRYEAAPGAKPVLSGGRIITGFKPAGEGVWAAQVPEVAAGKWYFEQLFVDGKRAVRAREPNRFWYYLQKVEEEVLNTERGADGRRAREARQTVKLHPDDTAILHGLKPDELKDVNLVVYHNWDNTRRFIDSFDAAASTCKRNTIRFNHVHHLGKGLLSDMGGIYTLGPSEGTVVANNIFHDVSSYSYGGWGLYTDEGSTGITFEDNLVYNTKDGSFHQHYGKENIVRNNILVDSKERQIAITRTEPHQSITFERNIIVWETGPALSGAWGKAQTVSGGNCWFNSAGAPVEFMGKPLAEWQKAGHETGSIIADPLRLSAYRYPSGEHRRPSTGL